MTMVFFDFICPSHGIFETYFTTEQYPDRNFPKFLPHYNFRNAPMCTDICDVILNTKGMQPDSYWSGKEIKSLGITVNSKDYLKRYCRTNKITQVTDEEVKTTKKKSKNELIQEYVNRPDVARERLRTISESIDQHGIIDSVNMEK